MADQTEPSRNSIYFILIHHVNRYLLGPSGISSMCRLATRGLLENGSVLLYDSKLAIDAPMAVDLSVLVLLMGPS